MYMDLIEVLDLIRVVLQERYQAEIEYFRTLESATLEEYVVTEKKGVRKDLLFRVWPVLYGHQRRLDCKIYDRGQRMSELIMYYLGICAVEKKEDIPRIVLGRIREYLGPGSEEG
jgi:hypothetical protein